MGRSRIWLLKHRPLVHQLKESAWRRLLQTGKSWDCVRGQILCGPDDEGGQAYLVRAGRVRINTFGPDGHEVVAGILEEGELFGQRARVDGPASEGYVEALSNGRVLILPQAEIHALLARETPLLAERLARAMEKGASRD
ncbi:MAG TPA: cyclic nucleotide-binding domain-containing protein [Candidatus Krumholzibacteria bacterium]|nr:cyclic nucleotide-binding domain-containing protein [Candidatus Krumholzibacteria bacterium]